MTGPWSLWFTIRSRTENEEPAKTATDDALLATCGDLVCWRDIAGGITDPVARILLKLKTRYQETILAVLIHRRLDSPAQCLGTRRGSFFEQP
jgi:hypothetical protein